MTRATHKVKDTRGKGIHWPSFNQTSLADRAKWASRSGQARRARCCEKKNDVLASVGRSLSMEEGEGEERKDSARHTREGGVTRRQARARPGAAVFGYQQQRNRSTYVSSALIAESRATTTATATEKQTKKKKIAQTYATTMPRRDRTKFPKGKKKKRAETEKHTGGADKRKGSCTRTPDLSAWSQKATHEEKENQPHTILKRQEEHNRNEKQVKFRGRVRAAEGGGMARNPADTAPRKHKQLTNQGKTWRKDRRRLWRAREGKVGGGHNGDNDQSTESDQIHVEGNPRRPTRVR